MWIRRLSFACAVVAGVGGESAEGQTFQILHNFDGGHGRNPGGQLVLDSQGNIYGVTAFGGTGSYSEHDFPVSGGTAYELANDGTFTVLYNFCTFAYCLDGGRPAGGLVSDSNGNLYGTTLLGGKLDRADGVAAGGIVFELSHTAKNNKWTKTTIYSFCSLPHCADGDDPVGGLSIDALGNIYGTTSFGGKCQSSTDGCGVMFELSPNGDGTWAERVLHRFQYTTTVAPVGNTTYSGGAEPVILYGTDTYAGAYGSGTLFQIKP